MIGMTVPIDGFVAQGFERVRDEFRRNFESRRELGAAFAVYQDGSPVVDLWGGYRDVANNDLWRQDTMALVFSTTKGMAALATVVAHSQGLFELDRPVASYWPEFGQEGKERITVRQLLAHEAGLAALDEPLDASKLADLDFVARVIARQKPAWEPGTRHGYHGLSLGFYQGELIRRTDRKRRSLGRFFHEEIAQPLDLHFYIGLPASVPESRLAVIKGFHPARMMLHLGELPAGMVLSLLWPRSLTSRALLNPKMKRPTDMGNKDYRSVEFASGSGIGEARAIAKAYGTLAIGGQQLGIREDTLSELIAPPKPARRDAVLKANTTYEFGFWKPCEAFLPGMNSKVFGAHGAGGSIGFCDPQHRLGYAYVMNRMGFRFFDEPREAALRRVVYECIGSPLSSV